jgi:hypothetical protein
LPNLSSKILSLGQFSLDLYFRAMLYSLTPPGKPLPSQYFHLSSHKPLAPCPVNF